MRSTEFHLYSPWGLVLLVVVPALLCGLFAAERRWRKGMSKSGRSGEAELGQRGTLLMFLLSAVATLGGSLACGWVLVFGSDEPFENPVFLGGLSLLCLVAILAALALWLRGRSRPVFVLATAPVLQTVVEGRPSALRFLAPTLRLLAILLVVAALARPQVSTTEADVFAEGMDILLTLDVSTTMRAVDFAPPSRPAEQMNRIDGAKEVISRFIRQRRDDRLGLVVFSAEAFTQCPLTLDYSVIENVLRSVQSGVIEDGTAIGDAVMVSINRFRDSESKSKVIILLTDGDDNMSRVAPLQAAEIAAKQNIKIFPILVGKGGKVPYPVGTNPFGQTQFQQVEIRTNPELLQGMAKTTNGQFYRAVDQTALEEDLQDVLDRMEKTRLMDPGRFTRHTEVFQLALLPAVLMLLFELALRWTRFRSFP